MALRNIHPADELAMIRADMRRLSEREAFLRRGFLTLDLPTRGDEVVASVKILKKRRFLREKLPPAILENEQYWETATIRQVCVDAVGGPYSSSGATDMADVLEPF